MTLNANDEARLTTDVVTEFLSALFGATESPIFFQTLANDANDADEAPNKQKVLTRDIPAIERFIKRHDRSRRGLFFCVSTIALGSPTRNKELCREIVVGHTDLDFRSIEEDEPAIRRVLDTLPRPPSCIVFSGGGLHLYWLMKEPLDAQLNRDRIESLNRGLANMLAGDTQATDVCRLMRLPGTTNSKYESQRKAAVEKLDAAQRYDLEELEDWVAEARPLLTPRVALPKAGKGTTQRKPKGSNRTLQEQPENTSDPTNPYLKVAEEQGWKPPLDVEQMLNSMVYPGNIHDTQIRVAASMLKSGYDLETVVGVVLGATLAAVGREAEKWDWKAEEKAIRDACAGAYAKFNIPPPSPPPSQGPQLDNPDTVTGNGAPIGAENVIPFDKAERKGSAKSRKRAQKANLVHVVLAQAVLTVLEQEGHRLKFTEKGAYRYWDGLWHQLDDKPLRGWLDAALEQGAQGMRLESTARLISEARSYIIRQPSLWGEAGAAFDAHGMVPTASGLIDPVLGISRPVTPEDYCTWRVPFRYAPEAACPNWLTMMDDAFADRPDKVREGLKLFLQEVVGMGLIDGPKAKALCRALIFLGGSNAGKSDMIDVMAGLFGPDVITADLTSLEGAHGLMPFARRVPWVLHEAFDQSKWHLSSTVKALISGEAVQINVKNGPMVSKRIGIPIFWGTNNPPQFKEATAAIINRIAIVEFRRRFDEDHPVGAGLAARAAGYEKPSELVLATEMEGVLAWAVEGLLRAKARGYFILPEESRHAAEAVRLDSNIVAGFVADCVTFNPNGMVSTPDFTAAFTAWWASEKGSDRRPPSSDSVGRALKALADPRIALDKKELRTKTRRYYAGVSLNAAGREFWGHAVASEAMIFSGIKASTSSEGENPNQPIPGAWEGKEVVRAMRKAQAKAVTLKPGSFPGDAPMESVTDDSSPGDEKGHGSVTGKGHPGEALDLSEDPPF